MRSELNIFTLGTILVLSSVIYGQAEDRTPLPTSPEQPSAEQGMVFLDGEYLPPPYEVRIQDNRLTINDRPASEPPAARPNADSPPSGINALPERRGQRGFGERGRREFGPPPFPRPGEAKAVRDHLEAGAILVYLPGRPHVMLNRSFAREYLLRCFIEKSDRTELVDKLTSSLGDQIDHARWRTWLMSFEAPANVVVAAKEELAELKRLDEAGREAFDSQLRLKAFAYPLTVVGMVLAVFALGHLLQSPPDNRVRPQSTRRCARHCRAAVVSLVLIALLSALDLTWTLLASQAGQMTELNPIGSRMLDQPTLLAALKVGSTVMSCGVLLMIRRHPRAQLATWWLCLVCTVLTFRWLVLNSMFVV